MRFVRFVGIDGIPRKAVEENGKLRETEGDWFGGWAPTGRDYDADEIKLLSPIQPNILIGIANNYAPPGQPVPDCPELPLFFLKPGSTVIGPEIPIRLPPSLQEVKFEAELVAIIGKEARNVEESEALDYVFGYTLGNDVTAPQLFHPAGPWTLGKAYDTFMPLGPAIVRKPDLSALRVRSRLDGVLRQDSPLSCMIMSVAAQIAYLSRVMTLRPGDALLTGAPEGAGMMGRGAVLECDSEEIGTLRNPVF
ncbi:fumarylacetoacetate hydrolase family protein [Cohnella sp. GCM10027633]|uniref:fumarylacetoacetate hydrolase family protein n=1 Tax=unclassified Cohnella TaxID=2636738 RepID=UPI00363AD7BB